jgi:type 1 glutamine amidotransferase
MKWLICSLMMLAGAGVLAAEETNASFRVLVFSKTLGYRHDSIVDGIKTITELGREHGFAVDATEDSNAFATTNLDRYGAIVFLSVTGDVLNDTQKDAMKNYVTGGGGFAAIHGAMYGPAACESNWVWYGEMFCCAFKNHSAVVPATVNIEDAKHPSTVDLPAQWQRTDEWYNFTGTPRGCAHVLATVDEKTYAGGNMGKDHPIAWCRNMGKGRMWFTAMGHTGSSFAEPHFRKHILGGILSVAGARVTWKKAERSLALMNGTNVIWQIVANPAQGKPYFHPLATPGGTLISDLRPQDHPWHLGLWFSWKFINGLNYWEYKPGTRREEAATELTGCKLVPHDDGSASLSFDISYHPWDSTPVLTEKRTVEISAPVDGRYEMNWTSEFTAVTNVSLTRTPPPGEPGGVSYGGYAGLSLRCTPALAKWTFTNSASDTGEKAIHGQPANWLKLSAGANQPAVAIYDNAGNPRHPSPWYGVASMPYFSPAILFHKTMDLKAGEKLMLRYRIVVTDHDQIK